MTDAATTPTAAADTAPAALEERATAKVVQLRAKVQEGADALNGWAHVQARALGAAAKDLGAVAKEKPLAAAGISAGTAFAAGLALGLLLARVTPEPTWKDRILDLKPRW